MGQKALGFSQERKDAPVDTGPQPRDHQAGSTRGRQTARPVGKEEGGRRKEEGRRRRRARGPTAGRGGGAGRGTRRRCAQEEGSDPPCAGRSHQQPAPFGRWHAGAADTPHSHAGLRARWPRRGPGRECGAPHTGASPGARGADPGGQSGQSGQSGQQTPHPYRWAGGRTGSGYPGNRVGTGGLQACPSDGRGCAARWNQASPGFRRAACQDPVCGRGGARSQWSARERAGLGGVWRGAEPLEEPSSRSSSALTLCATPSTIR